MTQERPFQFSAQPIAIRADISEAFPNAWRHIATPSSGWSGVERVAIAEECRTAWNCELCDKRKQALSPNMVKERHADSEHLPLTAIEAVHRITTDAGRLTESWFDGLISNGLTDSQYVEIVGIVGTVTSIDTFCRALGVAMESARSELLNAIGPVGLVDAAGVVGNFERMNRIADASGLELDAPVRILSAYVRDELGLHNLPSARNTKPSGLLAKFAARMVIPVAARFFSKRKSEQRIRSL